jgi:hypothetical protein
MWPLRQPASDYALIIGVWLIVAAVGLFSFYWLRDQPFFYDSAGYIIESRSISDHGLLSKWTYSDIRSYGYPFFLTWSLSLARLLHHGEHAGIFVTQWPLFVGTAWLATRSLFTSPRMRLAAFFLLAANPLLVIYSVQAFTESLTLTCVLFATAALGFAMRAEARVWSTGWLVAGALVSSYAFVVRPGSFLLPVCYAASAAYVLLRRPNDGSYLFMGAAGGLVLIALVVPLIPQVLINNRHYGTNSPFPTYGVATVQAEAGVAQLRYVSNVADCGGYAFTVPNPHPPSDKRVSTFGALRYYALSWPEGPEAALIHVFSGLDPRPFLIDQSDFGTSYERVLQAFTVAILLLASLGLRQALQRFKKRRGTLKIDAAFLGLVTVIFVGILAASHGEYRFGSVPLIAISILAAVGACRAFPMQRGTFAQLTAAYIGLLLLWVTFSDLLLSTSPVWRQCS